MYEMFANGFQSRYMSQILAEFLMTMFSSASAFNQDIGGWNV